MADGSDAIADWPLLNALVNTSSGATWVSIHHGGGVGIGRSIHAGMVVRRRRHRPGRAEARAGAARPIPGMGVIRHVDAGYERAVEVAAERGVRIPMAGACMSRRRSWSRATSGATARCASAARSAPEWVELADGGDRRQPGRPLAVREAGQRRRRRCVRRGLLLWQRIPAMRAVRPRVAGRGDRRRAASASDRCGSTTTTCS